MTELRFCMTGLCPCFLCTSPDFVTFPIFLWTFPRKGSTLILCFVFYNKSCIKPCGHYCCYGANELRYVFRFCFSTECERHHIMKWKLCNCCYDDTLRQVLLLELIFQHSGSRRVCCPISQNLFGML